MSIISMIEPFVDQGTLVSILYNVPGSQYFKYFTETAVGIPKVLDPWGVPGKKTLMFDQAYGIMLDHG